MKTPKSLIALIVVLAICFTQDLFSIATGDIVRADVYYLPLLKLDLGELEQPIVDSIIKSNAELVFANRIAWLIVHGIALGLSLMVLRKTRQSVLAAAP